MKELEDNLLYRLTSTKVPRLVYNILQLEIFFSELILKLVVKNERQAYSVKKSCKLYFRLHHATAFYQRLY